MAEILTTSAQLRSKAEELSNINAKFKQQVDQLESTETTLVSMWEGDSKEAFHGAFNNDKVQMHNFYNAIAQYVSALNQIATNYDNAEKANVEVGTTRTYKG
jgi:WXG100 family type VII secretion target